MSTITGPLRIDGTISLSKGVALSGDTGRIDELQREIDQLEIKVDSLIPFANHYEFPSTGSPNKLYVASDEDVIYYWKNGAYVPLSGVDALQNHLAEIHGGGSL